ncbi:MAG TPA: four-carbon acid sugar kinase family protein [Opitutaceae bacterium]|nr:four-carbon acid sugar kinase family protein [Opitutaceae bacterium]
MSQVRIIADDLTGALDTAAQFATARRPIAVFFGSRLPSRLPRAFAIDAATREMNSIGAAAVATRDATLLAPMPGAIAFKKVDSLLRGHGGLELVATLRAVRVTHCVVAPAYPVHGRVTRGGLQFAMRAGSWHRVGEDLRATLESHGISVRAARAGEAVLDGISLWDAESDEDLRRIADAGRAVSPPVLWCGCGGLAGALADWKVPAAGGPDRPILGLFGSDHPTTEAQLGACGGHVLRLKDGGPGGAALVSGRLAGAGVCLVTFDLPNGMARFAASELIAREIAQLTRRVRPPRSLLVAGGETLRALCHSLATDHLDVVGQMVPGVPVSVMRGGRWDGVRVTSKSGAFGQDMLLHRLLGLEVPGRGKKGAR